MNRNMRISFTALAIALTLPALSAFAMDHSSMGHGSGAAPAAPSKAMDAMDHSKMAGDMIQTSKLDKGVFTYNLIDNAAQMEKAMAGGMKMDHSSMQMKPNHLMVYPVGTDSKPISGAKVGYLITGPGEAKQQVMTMAMGDGYGADVDLKAKGKYEIKTKLVKGETTVVDTFQYEVK